MALCSWNAMGNAVQRAPTINNHQREGERHVDRVQARKLRESMKQELNETAAALVFKCAVYLLLFIGLAWLGATREAPSALRVQPLERQALAQPDPASKAVFEDRRERYVRANPGSQVAREHRMQRQQDAHADGGYFAYQSE